MWFWPVNEMTELVSGMPAPQFGDESSRVRGSGMVQDSSGSVRSFGAPHKVSSFTPGVRASKMKTCVSQTRGSSCVHDLSVGGPRKQLLPKASDVCVFYFRPTFFILLLLFCCLYETVSCFLQFALYGR
jgi:hypothetical protein